MIALRSVVAIFAGLLTIVVLSVGTDVVLNAVGVFPTLGGPMRDSPLMLATVYRTIYAVLGAYIAARLAPARPIVHALILGCVGLILGITGAVMTWNTESTIGHEWYPIALVVLALPPSWLGGKLCEMHQRSK
jgi:surface polysaccharide O-acyltransferase-like enzyme